MKAENKLQAVNPFYQRVGQQYLARIEQENKRRETETKPVVEDKKPIVVPEVNQIAELDRSNWVVVPRVYSQLDYSYAVTPSRLSACPAVEKVVKELRLNNYTNTGKDYLGRDFVGNNNWFEFMKLNAGLGLITPDMQESFYFWELLKDGAENKRKVYDVSGKIVDSSFLQKLHDDFFKVQSPWRGNYIGTEFKKDGENIVINSHHTLEKGVLVPQKRFILDKDTLIEDRGISVEDWISISNTEQGLPSDCVNGGNLSYMFPRDGSVAGLVAGSVGANLYCCRYPSGRGSDLGVLACFVRVEDIK